jgi:hypothetical protein
MGSRLVRRVAVLVAALTLATAGYTTADTLLVEADVVTPTGVRISDLGEVTPGAVIERDVSFILSCSGTKHVNANQQVVLEPGAATVPVGGGEVSAAGATFPAPGSSWPADGTGCPSTPAPVKAENAATVTVTAPLVDGKDYEYLVTWTRALSPAAIGDTGTFTGGVAVTFLLDVVSNTPPVLTLPADFIVEANTTGGWTADWQPTAVDKEDDPDPTPVCTPTVGSVLPLGPTSVECSVADSKGLTDSGALTVTVVDSTAPSLANIPTGLNLVTADPAGKALAYGLPTASDVVDAKPKVECRPAPGDMAPVGQSVVDCKATDESGNSASSSFPVRVEFWRIGWLDPLPDAAGALDAETGRVVPIKVRAWRDGTEVTTGAASLRVTSCSDAATLKTLSLSWTGADRWFGKLDLSGVAAGCHRAVLSMAGVDVATFELRVRAPAG